MFENLLFVSYRRSDAAPHALALKLELESQFRAAQVFVDTHHIQGGDRWPREIEMALNAAKVVLPIVGQSWVGPTPEGGRRIDDSNDWVRKEIELALRLKPEAVIPLFVDGVKAVPTDLPESCNELGFKHGIHIDLNTWHASVDTLVGTLSERFGYARKRTRWRLPTPDPLVAKTIPIPWTELEKQVTDFLRDWSIEFSDDDERLHHKRIELTRSFEFEKFTEAIRFIDTVAEHAKEVQHHPRWMNAWKTVKVWLCTWDAGHVVTALDLEFARYLDRVGKKFGASQPR